MIVPKNVSDLKMTPSFRQHFNRRMESVGLRIRFDLDSGVKVGAFVIACCKLIEAYPTLTVGELSTKIMWGLGSRTLAGVLGEAILVVMSLGGAFYLGMVIGCVLMAAYDSLSQKLISYSALSNEIKNLNGRSLINPQGMKGLSNAFSNIKVDYAYC